MPKIINKIVAIIPAFNEEKRIEKVIKDIEKYVTWIIIIDDGSSDNTFSVVKKIKNSKITILNHSINLGQGAALQTGLEYAKKINADIVITYDADGQFNASDIPKLIQQLLDKKVDIVLGSRFLGEAINIPFLKLITLKIGILFTFIFSGAKLTDTHNGFRVFNKKALKKIKITQNRMAHASEIIDQIQKYKLTYLEVPVTIKYDNYSKKKGQSITNSFNIIFDLISKKLYS